MTAIRREAGPGMGKANPETLAFAQLKEQADTASTGAIQAKSAVSHDSLDQLLRGLNVIGMRPMVPGGRVTKSGVVPEAPKFENN